MMKFEPYKTNKLKRTPQGVGGVAGMGGDTLFFY